MFETSVYVSFPRKRESGAAVIEVEACEEFSDNREAVIPAKAGMHCAPRLGQRRLDPGFRRGDGFALIARHSGESRNLDECLRLPCTCHSHESGNPGSPLSKTRR